MKAFWYEFCVQVWASRATMLALLLVIATWVLLAEWVLAPVVRDHIVYFCFGWFVLGKVLVPWIEHKLTKLFS